MNKYINYVRHPITNVVMSNDINVVERFRYTTMITETDDNGNQEDVEYDCIFFSGSIYEIDEPTAIVKYSSGLNLKPIQIQSTIPVESNFIIGKNIRNVKSYLNINGKNNTKWTHSFNGHLFFTYRKEFLNPHVYPLGTLIEKPTDNMKRWCLEFHPDWMEGDNIRIPKPNDQIFFGRKSMEYTNGTIGEHSHTIDIGHEHSTQEIEHSHTFIGTTKAGKNVGDVTREVRATENALQVLTTDHLSSELSGPSDEILESINNSGVEYSIPDRIRVLVGVYLV